MKAKNINLIKIFITVFVVVLVMPLGIWVARAFVGPTDPPPGGSGILNTNGSNLIIGSSTVPSDTKFTITTPLFGGENYLFKITDGRFGASLPTSYNTFVAIRNSTATPPFGDRVGISIGSLLHPDDVTDLTGFYDSGIDQDTPRIYVRGRLLANTIRAQNIYASGTIVANGASITINAGNVSAGTFGSLTGNGNYYFPGKLGVNATSTPLTHPLTILQGGATGFDLIDFKSSTGTSQFSVKMANGDLIFNNGAIPSKYNLILKNNGAIGIGVLNPSQLASFEVGLNSFFTGSLSVGSAGLPDVTFYTSATTTLAAVKGNVGIGQSNPTYKLDVSGTSRFTATSTHQNDIRLSQSGTAIVFPDGTRQTTAANPGSGSQNYISKWAAGGATLTNSVIYDDGTNVGVGVASPGAKLDIAPASGVSATLLRSSSGLSGGLYLYSVVANAPSSGATSCTNAIGVTAICLYGLNSAGGNVGCGASGSAGIRFLCLAKW